MNKTPGVRLHVISFDQIDIGERERKEFDEQAIMELAGSIADTSLLHAPVVRTTGSEEYTLVAGERRLKALEYLWGLSTEVRCGGQVIPEGFVPVLFLGELDPISALEAEIEENIRRKDFTWQEKARAVAKLKNLRDLQAQQAGTPEPTLKEIAADPLMKSLDRGGNPESGSVQAAVREDLIIAKHLLDPEIAKAKTSKDAMKLIKRREELARSAKLSSTVGATFSRADHTLLKGDCIEHLKSLPDSSFDVILTDPPYGMGASDFGTSSGKVPGSHFYDDSPEAFKALMEAFIPASYRLAKPNAHLYLWFDIDWFSYLKGELTLAGWKVFRTPITWVNPTAMRIPWIDKGPQRKSQWCIYAMKGEKNVLRLAPDVVTYPSDENLNHHAQKPVGLFGDLLSRSARAGDSVLDPFCGTGTIFPVAHAFKVRAVGIEIDEAAHGIAAKRIQELK